ncbi:hypothetical protein COLO4_20463 [Corchorus olitorius]|uniref:Uncharacterized protein n=1 Tax=Corchorus olitorius TaxID=93759 RepID=A0A1R3IZV6_9ROSI|nr:hypothetical protein COLO4_20463 [Corchorus olitorius]
MRAENAGCVHSIQATEPQDEKAWKITGTGTG